MTIYFNRKWDTKKRRNAPNRFGIGKRNGYFRQSCFSKQSQKKSYHPKMVLSLIDVAKEKGETELVQAYWNAYNCLNNVIVSNVSIYGKYDRNQYFSSL